MHVACPCILELFCVKASYFFITRLTRTRLSLTYAMAYDERAAEQWRGRSNLGHVFKTLYLLEVNNLFLDFLRLKCSLYSKKSFHTLLHQWLLQRNVRRCDIPSHVAAAYYIAIAWEEQRDAYKLSQISTYLNSSRFMHNHQHVETSAISSVVNDIIASPVLSHMNLHMVYGAFEWPKSA